MTKQPFFLRLILILLLMLISVHLSYAQQIDIIPIQPAFQSLISRMPQMQTMPSEPAKPAEQVQAVSRTPVIEKLSEFEQFIAEKIDITETQFEILQKYEIMFSQSISPPPPGKTRVAVRIIKVTENNQTKETDAFTRTLKVVDAGFLIGTREQFSTAFKLLEIDSPFTSAGIKQFGYNLFKQPSTFAAFKDVPVSPDYLLGPGDEIKINIWGEVEGRWNAEVDSSGNINLPKIGLISVAGLTFKELKDILFKEFSKILNRFDMNVTMGSLRTIRVYVVGSAQRPGAYTISSLSSLVNALFETGGPSKTGTMRNIQVKRNGKTIVSFDMYDLLLKGDKTKDTGLMPGDVIFIPPVGALAGISGSVNNPAIYELKGKTTVEQLIDMAGGLNAVAFKGRVQIEQVIDKSRQVVFEANLDDMQDKDIILHAGDIVKVFQIVQDRKTIRLSGAVQREGEYGAGNNSTTVKDLISMAGGLKYYAYTKEAELTRINITEEGPETEKYIINLRNAMEDDPAHNIMLKEDDYLFVRTIPEWMPYQTITIHGEVRFPGTYTIRKGEKLSSLIERAGGYTDMAYLRGTVFKRVKVKEIQKKGLDEMITRLEKEILTKGSAQVSTAVSREEVEARKVELAQQQQFIKSLKKIEPIGRLSVHLAHLRLLKGSEYDIELEEGDTINIPVKNSTVNVMGAVMSRGSFIYSQRMGYKDYIELTGGYTDNADKKNIYVLKVDGTARKLSRGFFNWNSSKSRWEMTGFGEEIKEIEPGDTVVVPEKLARIAWIREIKDIVQILYQIAVTAGVTLTIF